MVPRRVFMGLAATFMSCADAIAQAMQTLPQPLTSPSVRQPQGSITVSSTTSTLDSGLFNHILPVFRANTGIDVKVVSQGTGQALDTGQRGDRSGTHVAELSLWKLAAINMENMRGAWFRNIGQGMGAALNTSAAMGAYVLSDRATWISFKNRSDLEIMVEGDRHLFNQYGVILVNPARHPHIKAAEGQAFIDWLVSIEGQQAIGDYRIEGQQLFFANAAQPGA